MTRITPPDVSLWLCDHLRRQLTEPKGLQVGIRVPDEYKGTHPLIVIRDDGGSQSERLIFDRSLGITVYMGTANDPKPCRDLAALVYSILTDEQLAHEEGSPIAGIVEDGCNGVYAVNGDQPTCMYYMTVEYTAVPDL